jgi:archaeosine-15-forming tRNA-guanine transglycosylase
MLLPGPVGVYRFNLVINSPKPRVAIDVEWSSVVSYGKVIVSKESSADVAPLHAPRALRRQGALA